MGLRRLAEPALLTDQVFGALQGAIMSGELGAGSRLRLRDLAEQLGTSPMPVREAITRLEQTGLVVRVPHRGAVVADLTLAELAHVYEARLLLEVEATRRGAAAVTEEDVTTMRAERDQMLAAVRDGRLTDALDHDETLLAVLYGAGANPVLLELVRDLWRRCRAYKIIGAVEGSHSGSWSFQEPLIEAAAAHDVQAAADVTHRSVSDAVARIRASLEKAAPD